MIKRRKVLLRLVGVDKVTHEMQDKMMEAIEKGEYIPTKVGDDVRQYVAEAGSDQAEIDVSVRDDCLLAFTTSMMQGRNSNFEPIEPVSMWCMFKDTSFSDTVDGYVLSHPEMLIQGMKAASAAKFASRGEVDMDRVRKTYDRLAKVAEKNKLPEIKFTFDESSSKTERLQFSEHLLKVIFTTTKPSIAKACGGMVPLPGAVFKILDGSVNVDMEHPLLGFEATQEHSNNRLIQAVCYLLHNLNPETLKITQFLWSVGAMELEFAQHGDACEIYDYAWGHGPCPRAWKDTRAVMASKPYKGAFGNGAFLAAALLNGKLANPAYADGNVILGTFGLEKGIAEDGVIDYERLWIAVTNLLNTYIDAIEGGF
jgi:hypothetical protein